MNASRGIVFVVLSCEIRRLMRESMMMDAEKWRDHVHLDPRYQQVARQRRLIKHVLQIHREHEVLEVENNARGNDLPPHGLKDRVFQYIFGASWSSKK
jgi:hypothetical protein